VFGGGVKVGQHRTLSNRALYANNVWVNVSVNLLSRAIAKTPLKAYQDSGDGVERARLRGRGKGAHPLASVLERPYLGGTQFRFKNAIVHEYLLSDEGVAYAWMDREGHASGVPKRLIPMRGDQVSPAYDAAGKLAYYEWRQTPLSEAKKLGTEEVLRIGFEDGVSPLSALRKTLEIDIASQQTTASFYSNGAQVGSVITTEKSLKPDAIETLESQLNSDHKGPENAFRMLLLANLPGAQMHAGSMTSVDAQTVEHRKLAREEVLAAFHIP
jgi:HK97 family phage portal protein